MYQIANQDAILNNLSSQSVSAWQRLEQHQGHLRHWWDFSPRLKVLVRTRKTEWPSCATFSAWENINNGWWNACTDATFETVILRCNMSHSVVVSLKLLLEVVSLNPNHVVSCYIWAGISWCLVVSLNTWRSDELHFVLVLIQKSFSKKLSKSLALTACNVLKIKSDMLFYFGAS